MEQILPLMRQGISFWLLDLKWKLVLHLKQNDFEIERIEGFG
jgi:hypothetical protein